MGRREFIAGLGSAAAWSVMARAQQAAKYRPSGSWAFPTGSGYGCTIGVEASMVAYNILNMAHGWCISGQSNGGACALFYPPEGKLYNAWTFSQAAHGRWTIAKADDPSKVLVGSGNYC